MQSGLIDQPELLALRQQVARMEGVVASLCICCLFDTAQNSPTCECNYLPREGDYEMMPVCACVCACVRALVSHADFFKTTTATNFL